MQTPAWRHKAVPGGPQSSPAFIKGCRKLFYMIILLQNNVLGIFLIIVVCEITATVCFLGFF